MAPILLLDGVHELEMLLVLLQLGTGLLTGLHESIETLFYKKSELLILCYMYQ